MVKSTGHNGIGTVTPGTLLHVSSSNYGNALYVSGSGTNPRVGIGISRIDTTLQKFYKDRMKEQHGLDIIRASQKAGKALVPAWILSDWMKKYNMYF